MCKYTKDSLFVHRKFIKDCYDKNSSKEQCYDVVMFFITHKFFHNNCPGKPLPGHSSFIELPESGSFFAVKLYIGCRSETPYGIIGTLNESGSETQDEFREEI